MSLGISGDSSDNLGTQFLRIAVVMVKEHVVLSTKTNYLKATRTHGKLVKENEEFEVFGRLREKFGKLFHVPYAYFSSLVICTLG